MDDMLIINTIQVEQDSILGMKDHHLDSISLVQFTMQLNHINVFDKCETVISSSEQE